MSYFGSKLYDVEVRRGNVPGIASRAIIGHSDTVGTNLRTLYSETNTADLDTDALYDTPATIKVASTSANDTNTAGTGARTVRVHGVNSSGAEITEDFTLAGQTETAASAATFKAVHKVETLTVGSTGNNEGVVWVGSGTFTGGVPATKYGAVEIGTNLSAICHFLVPAAKTFYFHDAIINLSDTTKVMNAQFVAYNGTLITEIFDLHSRATSVNFDAEHYPGIPADTLIRVNANVDTGAAKSTIRLGGYLVDD